MMKSKSCAIDLWQASKMLESKGWVMYAKSRLPIQQKEATGWENVWNMPETPLLQKSARILGDLSRQSRRSFFRFHQGD